MIVLQNKPARAIISLAFLVLIYLPAGAAAGSKFKPFAGYWILSDSSGDIGHLSVDAKQKYAELVLEGIKLFPVKCSYSAKRDTILKLRASNQIGSKLEGNFKIETRTFKIIEGKIELSVKNGSGRTFRLVGRAAASSRYSRNAKAVLKIKPAGKRIAKVNQGFNIKAKIFNRGPSGLPQGKVLVFMQVPDSLSAMEVVSSSRMGECGSFLNDISNVRQAYCSIKSLGPGVPEDAGFTVRVLPGEAAFSSGGKFSAIVYIFSLTQDGLITVNAVQQQITVTVKGKKQDSQPSCDLCPPNCSCFRSCWYSDGPIEWDDWDWTRYCWRICDCGFR